MTCLHPRPDECNECPSGTALDGEHGRMTAMSALPAQPSLPHMGILKGRAYNRAKRVSYSKSIPE